MTGFSRKSAVAFIERQARWLLPVLVVVASAAMVDPSRLANEHFELAGFTPEVIKPLKNSQMRVAYLPEGATAPKCPGEYCPLNEEDAAHVSWDVYEKSSQNLAMRTTTKGWRGTMYVRWDTKLPLFADEPGDRVALDLAGITGDRWRFFVNGEERAQGQGGAQVHAIAFDSDGGEAGEPLYLGLEITVGRHLAPGVTPETHAFLSIPDAAAAIRASYRVRDRQELLPRAYLCAAFAIIAALGCFFTPFYREILAYAVGVALWNWRTLVINGLVPLPEFLGVDVVMLDAMARCAFYGCLWLFWPLYFRSRTAWALLPAAGFFALAAACLTARSSGDGLGVIVMVSRNNLLFSGLTLLGGTAFAARTWRETRGLVTGTFRHRLAAAFMVMTGLFAAVILAQQLMRWGMIDVAQLETPEARGLTPDWTQVYAIGTGLAIALEWALVVRDRQRVLRRFGTAIDPRVLGEVILDPRQPSSRIDTAVALAVDLRSFDGMCQRFSPEAVTLALNEFLGVVTSAVERNGGVIDRFGGTSVMALWGVPARTKLDPMGPIDASLAIRRGMRDLNARRRLRGDFDLVCGVGVHAGPVIFGPVGTGQRVDFTAIGPTITLAARLESLTKDVGADILLSNDFHGLVADRILVERKGLHPLRGTSAHTEVLRLLGATNAAGEMVVDDHVLEAASLPLLPGVVDSAPTNLVLPPYSELAPAPVVERVA